MSSCEMTVFARSSVTSTSKRDCFSSMMASMYLSSVASTKNMICGEKAAAVSLVFTFFN